MISTRTLLDRPVGALGLGCMGMSFAYGTPDDVQSLLTLHRAHDLGVNHWDTADLYGAGVNETLVGRGLKAVGRENVVLATKFGNVFDRSLTSHQDLVAANAPFIVDNTDAYIRKSVEGSLRRLGTDHIDLYYAHRMDSRVPTEELMGSLSRLVEEGKVRGVGISEVNADTYRKAHAVHPVAAVQNELSLWTREFLADLLPATTAGGTAFVAYSPLGRGFLTGTYEKPEDFAEGDWRRVNPRFAADAMAANLAIVDVVREVAQEVDATPGQVALAWALAQAPNVLPIPGTKRVKYLEENVGGASVTLSADHLVRLDALQVPSGSRYPEAMSGTLAR